MRAVTCSEFRDEVGVVLGGHRSALQRHHGDAAVNVDLHRSMAAMLLALLTLRLLEAALVLGAVLLRRGAALRWDGDLLRAWCPPAPTTCSFAAGYATCFDTLRTLRTAGWKQPYAAATARHYTTHRSRGIKDYAQASCCELGTVWDVCVCTERRERCV